MKTAALGFGAMLALLLVVALSVPLGPPDARGYSPTLLQWGTPLVIGLGVALVALLLFAKILLATLRDRRDERRTFAYLSAQQNQTYQSNLQLLAGVTAQQAALVQQALSLGAYLVEERGQYYAQLPGSTGSRFPLDAIEAEYWQEVTQEGTTETRRHGDFYNYPTSAALPAPSSQHNRQSRVPAGCVNRQFFSSSRSMASSTCSDSGGTLLRKRAITSPFLATRNFSKFQLTSPTGSTALLRRA